MKFVDVWSVAVRNHKGPSRGVLGPRRLRTVALALLVVLCAAPARAQMQSGSGMKDYDKVLGVDSTQGRYAFDVIPLEDKTSDSNILPPGKQPSLVLLLRNNTAEPIKTHGHIDVMRYGTRGITGNMWLPEVFKFEDLPPIPIDADIAAKGTQELNVQASLPETFGAYAFVVDLGASGRRLALSIVRTFAPTPRRIQFPTIALDAGAGVPILRDLGVQAVRMEWGYRPETAGEYNAKMADLDARMQSFASNNITVLLTLYESDSSQQPLGRPRPFLNDQDQMLNGKADMACLPSADADFQQYVTRICEKYGWPKGPVTAVQLWNEPWEGVSISGWGADMIRYRAIYTAMAQGVVEARKSGVQVLITGCDSSANSMDKLFGDGKTDFLPWFDACTIHYQGLWSPALYRLWRDRTGPHGRVKIWDTESWVANSDDRIAALIAGCRAAGYDRTMGVFWGNIAEQVRTAVQFPDGTRRKVETVFPWPPAAAMGAVTHFIGQRPFGEFLFQNGLPWIMVFDGEAGGPDDGTLVVVGDLRETFPPEMLPFRGVLGLEELKHDGERRALRQQLETHPPENRRDLQALEGKLAGLDVLTGGSLTFADPAAEFRLYDFYGNPVPARNGTIALPLDSHGYFLCPNGTPGSFARLTNAVARIEGYEPVEILAHDFLAPVDTRPSLHLTVRNILNRPIAGTLTVSLGNLALTLPGPLTLAAHETKELLIPVTGGDARPDNTYALSVRFDAGADGAAVHAEALHVNLIARRSIRVDGKLDDWRGVLPQPVSAAGAPRPTETEAAWLPFEAFSDTQSVGVASGYLAYDATNFYFACKVADATPSAGMLRFATRDDDAYFYPETSYCYDFKNLLWRKEVTWNEPSRAKGALLLPGSDKERSFAAWVPGVKGPGSAFAVDLTLPNDAYRNVSFYFVDWDTRKPLGERAGLIEVQDPGTGRRLATTRVREYADGCYATFALAGKARVIFKSGGRLGISLSGIFFDPADADRKKPNPRAAGSAEFLASDNDTGGKWAPRYGKQGYVIAGAATNLPAGVTLTVPDEHPMNSYHWPEGVRRYSYRKRPDLPFGQYPSADNVQIAFNVIPPDEKPAMVANLPGVMPHFIPYQDTDYEYALNPVAAAYGGGTEIWRCMAPGMPDKNFYPREPASPLDGPVKDGQLVITRQGATRIVEAAIPWTELKRVKDAVDAGRTIKFTFRVNDDQGPAMELAEDRSVSQRNPYAFHVRWAKHWANELEFAVEK